MSEFFHNLSWQALTNDNDSIILEFDAVGELVPSINTLLRNEIHREKIEQIRRGKEVVDILSQNFNGQAETKQEEVEQQIRYN